MQRVYLDYNASTPIDPAVAAAMRPFLADHYGNPSSGHWAAAAGKVALETARAQVAALLRCRSDEIVFTSGGSEANNLALKGVFFAQRDRGDHIVTTRIEHPAIIEPCGFLERLGARVTYLPVDGTGRIDPDDLRRAITPRTILVSIMHANNEVGTIQPIEDCARIAHERGVLFHTDAAQSVGKVATEVKELGVDLLSIAGHKAYAPKGVGALFVRDGVSIEPLLHGAGHEHGRRAGTESVLLAAGLGKACELARDLSPMDRVRALRDRFWEALQKQIRQSRAAQWTSHPSAAEHAQCLIRWSGRCRDTGAARWCRRLDGIGVSLRSYRAVAGSGGHGCHARGGHGRYPLQSGAWDDARGHRRRCRASEQPTHHVRDGWTTSSNVTAAPCARLRECCRGRS
jgi:cysteine desulfurase